MKHPFAIFSLYLLTALCLFAFFPKNLGVRKLASCEESLAPASFPMESQLFSHIQDEALKKSALQYYTFLTQIEMNAIQGLESARTMYGLPKMSVGAGVNLYGPPTIVNFSLSSPANYQGSWGLLPGIQAPESNSIALLPVRSSLNFGH
jgi:hypothetical protein